MRICDVSKIGVLMLCAALGGCALTRSEINLGSLEAAPSAAPVTKSRAVLIRSVTDERVFEQAPKDPSTPSLGFEGAEKATADIKARAISRKRNTFGQALGDVLLENGQTVAGVIRDNLAAAFREAGYRVTNNPVEAGQSPVTMDVRIKRFWTWIRPGFLALTLTADIATDLEIQGASAPVVVTVHTEDSRQFGSDDARIELVTRTLKEYRAQVIAKTANLP